MKEYINIKKIAKFEEYEVLAEDKIDDVKIIIGGKNEVPINVFDGTIDGKLPHQQKCVLEHWYHYVRDYLIGMYQSGCYEKLPSWNVK